MLHLLRRWYQVSLTRSNVLHVRKSYEVAHARGFLDFVRELIRRGRAGHQVAPSLHLRTVPTMGQLRRWIVLQRWHWVYRRVLSGRPKTVRLV